MHIRLSGLKYERNLKCTAFYTDHFQELCEHLAELLQSAGKFYHFLKNNVDVSVRKTLVFYLSQVTMLTSMYVKIFTEEHKHRDKFNVSSQLWLLQHTYRFTHCGKISLSNPRKDEAL